MMLNWVTRESGETMLQIYIGQANYEEDNMGTSIYVFGSAAGLLLYVSYFTVLRFRRISREKKEFDKLNQLTYE